MKIIIDSKIPFVEGVFEPYGKVYYLLDNKITSDEVQDADVLIVRTRTVCNRKLLQNSKIQFIATATIGFDHIDTEYCYQNNIAWTNAPGCNSQAVAQYVIAAIILLALEHNIDLNTQTIGIVGVGHVGNKVAQLAQKLGMTILLNDLPIEQNEPNNVQFVPLSKIQKEADFITFHTPLITENLYKTFHLADADFFNNLHKQPFIINTSRGEVIDTQSLKCAIKKHKISGAVLDVWENEPYIDQELVMLTEFATTHIAGYSLQGKYNASKICVEAVSHFFGIKTKIPPFSNNTINITSTHLTNLALLQHCIKQSLDLHNETITLQNDLTKFEQIRSSYRLRNEFSELAISTTDYMQYELLTKLGFNVRF